MRARYPILFLLCLTAGRAAEWTGPTLGLRVGDEHGAPISLRVRVLDAQDRATAVAILDPAPAVAAHPNFPELGVIVTGQAHIGLPEGRSTVWIERGPEYQQIRIGLEGHAGTHLDRTVKLERWTDMAAKGWWSGDLHVHRDPHDMPALMDAADIHWAPAITCFNDTRPVTEWPAEAVVAAEPQRMYSMNNCEDERRWGAALFLGLRSAPALYPRMTEYPAPAETWREARKRGAYIDLEKAIWWDSPVVAALVPPDSIGVAVNHFLEDTVSTRASLARPRDETKYSGGEGFARYIFDLYATYLSAGFRIPASAGSANGVSRNALGYNRSYVYLGPNFSAEAWMEGQKSGRNFVTNGPMLAFSVNGQLPGSILPDDSGEGVVKLDCESRDELDWAEVIQDGESVDKIQAAPGSPRISAVRHLRPRSGSWVLGRCFERNAATVRFAQSSPVYFGRLERKSAAANTYLRDWVDAEIHRLEQVSAELLTASQKKELLEYCRKARERYQ